MPAFQIDADDGGSPKDNTASEPASRFKGYISACQILAFQRQFTCFPKLVKPRNCMAACEVPFFPGVPSRP